MRYEIRFIEDHQLPEGHDWMLIQSPAACMVFVKTSAVCPAVLMQAWAGYRALEVEPLSA